MSEVLKAALLGLVQGVTEFLPVSSSGHLAVLQHYLGFKGDRLFFDVMLHFATLLAVLVYFRREIVDYLRRPRVLALVVLVCIPTGVVGLLLKDRVEVLLYHPKFVAIMFLFTAAVDFLIDRVEGIRPLEELGTLGALFVGLCQGVAVVPGISRSGSTMLGSLVAGVYREEAAPFVFIVSIPAILGATLLEVVKAGTVVVFDAGYLAGMVTAFVAGLMSIWLFVKLLRIRRFYIFSVYLVVLSLLVLIF